jgi:hypothetical protein
MKPIETSMTNQGLAIEILIFLVEIFKLNILPQEIQGVVMAIGALIGFGMIFYGRWRKKDLYLKRPN